AAQDLESHREPWAPPRPRPPRPARPCRAMLQPGPGSFYATAQAQGLSRYEKSGIGTSLPSGPTTDEALRLLRLVAAAQADLADAQADLRREVLDRLDRLDGSAAGGAAAAAAQAPGRAGPCCAAQPDSCPSPRGSAQAGLAGAGPPRARPGAPGAGEAEQRSSPVEAPARASMARSRTYNSQRASVKSQRASADYTEVRLQKLGLSGTSDSLDEKGLAEGTWRARCFAMLAHPMFDLFISTVIVLNSIMMGVELTVQPSAESGTPQTRLFFGVMESVFLVVYIVELACRFYACGASCLRSSWVKFDVLIVTVGVIGDWLVPIILLASGEAIAKPSYLQIFRLARVGRAVRLFVQFRILWMLVSGIISSISTIVNVLIVLVLVLFAFSCLGVEVITNHAKSSQGGEFQNLVQEHWSSLPHTMLTLVQFVTLDSIGAIYAPMIREDLWLTLFFVPFILVVSIILMNLVIHFRGDRILHGEREARPGGTSPCQRAARKEVDTEADSHVPRVGCGRQRPCHPGGGRVCPSGAAERAREPPEWVSFSRHL
ncbi:unnamed protein product, partial [Prorocentrum cordatum]